MYYYYYYYLSRCVRNVRKKEEDTDDKGHGYSPCSEKECESRRQADLVDMLSMPWTCICICPWSMPSTNGSWHTDQDHLTKFCVQRPIKSERPTEVAATLMDIFFLGAPAILQSYNGTEL